MSLLDKLSTMISWPIYCKKYYTRIAYFWGVLKINRNQTSKSQVCGWTWTTIWYNDWDGNHRFGIMVWINGLGSIVVKPCIFNQWCFFQSPFFATRFGWLTQHYQHLPTIDVGCVFQFDLQFKMVLRAWYLEQNKPFSEPKYIDGSPWQGCSNLLYDPSCMHIITAKGRNWSSPFFPQPVSQPCIYFSVGLQSQFSSWIFYHKRRFLLLSLCTSLANELGYHLLWISWLLVIGL
jgi:hypothetical protein